MVCIGQSTNRYGDHSAVDGSLIFEFQVYSKVVPLIWFLVSDTAVEPIRCHDCYLAGCGNYRGYDINDWNPDNITGLVV